MPCHPVASLAAAAMVGNVASPSLSWNGVVTLVPEDEDHRREGERFPPAKSACRRRVVADQSASNASRYIALAGDQTSIRSSPLTTACAPSTLPIGRRSISYFLPSAVALKASTAAVSQRFFSVP